MSDSLEGRQIILAGGSGGLGMATVEMLAPTGAELTVGFAHNADRAEQLSSVATVIRTDITQPEARTRLLDCAARLYGLVVLVGDPARVVHASQLEEALRRSHEINYLGPILLAREAAERMRRFKSPGAIVLISTMQAVAVFANSTAYAGAKAALVQAGRILAKEYRGQSNIRVNIICPGVNAAGMAQASISSGKYDRYLQDNSIPRFGKATDVARAVRFFLEPDNYITGQVLTVDGGLTL